MKKLLETRDLLTTPDQSFQSLKTTRKFWIFISSSFSLTGNAGVAFASNIDVSNFSGNAWELFVECFQFQLGMHDHNGINREILMYR